MCLLSDDFPLSCNVDRLENRELCVSDRGKAVGSTARNEVKYIFKSFKLSENDHCKSICMYLCADLYLF